jgi:prepilin peptidase CpaA
VIVFSTLCAGLGGGAVVDSARRRIPNAISLGTAVAGVTLAATGISGVTIASALFGFFIGFILMMPGHIFGATGAGDVKLFAAAGTLLGADHVVPAFLLTAIAGGVLALGVAWWRGRLGRTMSLTARLFGRPAAIKADIESPIEHNRFPYGPAIAVGCVLAALI